MVTACTMVGSGEFQYTDNIQIIFQTGSRQDNGIADVYSRIVSHVCTDVYLICTDVRMYNKVAVCVSRLRCLHFVSSLLLRLLLLFSSLRRSTGLS